MKRIISAGIVILILAGCLIYFSQTPVSTLRYWQLDIGQGDSAVVRTPDGVTIVIDTGSSQQIIDALAAVLPWNDRQIDYLLLTHPDSDHYGGTEYLLDRYSIGTVLFNGQEEGGSPAYAKLLADIRSRHISLRAVGFGEEINFPSGVHWDLLWPPAGYDGGSTNANCVVSRIRWGQEKILLPCDLPSEQEQLLLTKTDLQAQILKAGHHGSKFSSSAAWLEAVQPQWCLISAGRNNRYGHPNPAAVTRLQRTGCQLLSTIDSGTLSFELSSTSSHYLAGQDRLVFGLPIGAFLAILNPFHY